MCIRDSFAASRARAAVCAFSMMVRATCGFSSKKAVSYTHLASHDHMVFPGMVYISHPSEYGTLYTKNELERLSAAVSYTHLDVYKRQDISKATKSSARWLKLFSALV